jgi:hypothetical protein
MYMLLKLVDWLPRLGRSLRRMDSRILSRMSYYLVRADTRVIQGKVEDIELPVKHVDVIVSEWMVSQDSSCR